MGGTPPGRHKSKCEEYPSGVITLATTRRNERIAETKPAASTITGTTGRYGPHQVRLYQPDDFCKLSGFRDCGCKPRRTPLEPHFIIVTSTASPIPCIRARIRAAGGSLVMIGHAPPVFGPKRASGTHRSGPQCMPRPHRGVTTGAGVPFVRSPVPRSVPGHNRASPRGGMRKLGGNRCGT